MGSMLHPNLEEMIAVTREAKNSPLSRISLAEIRGGPTKMKLLAGEPKPSRESHESYHSYLSWKSSHTPLLPQDNKPLPCVLYFHPGGFVKGDIDTHDSVCRHLADVSGCLISSINYPPKAPEHPYSQALHTAKEAFLWVTIHYKEINGDGRIAIEEVGTTLKTHFSL